MITYNSLIILSWAAFLAVWGIAALGVKRDLSGGGLFGLVSRSPAMRVVMSVLIVLLAARFAAWAIRGAASGGNRAVVVLPRFVAWIGACLTALGIAFAIWARVHLGANWSARPAVKQDHDLVTSGPYCLVRHPIYTGLILATFGTALTGTAFGMIAFVFASIVFLLRIGKEERLMLGLFPDAYPAYQARTRRLIPFLW